MPYRFESQNKRIGKENDKRRKLTDQDKEKIKSLYKQGTSIREITRIINKVDRRAIQFVLFQERQKNQYKRAKLRNWYYNREKHNQAMRRYRQRLKALYS